MDYNSLPVGQLIPDKDDWLYRDSYNQVWRVVRNNDFYIPLRISLEEKLTPLLLNWKNFLGNLK